MPSINVSITQPVTGTVISTIGNESTYITLTMCHVGTTIELVTGLTVYHAMSGHYEYEELAREQADDEDEAEAIATDLEYAATEKLISMDVADYWKEPKGFPEALIQHFDRVYASALAAA